MKLTLDTESQTLTLVDAGHTETLPLYSKQAFEAISRQWVRVGWNQKYQYTFSWMGRPVIQLPEDCQALLIQRPGGRKFALEARQSTSPVKRLSPRRGIRLRRRTRER